MDIITTEKKWEAVLSMAALKDLLQVLDGCRLQNGVADAGTATACLLLFYGENKENKTAAAALAATELKRKAYRVDTAGLVSAHIGETEKNLDLVFSKAANQNWLLFFDEADALFGKRTDVKDSHDKYANQEASYLLQKIADGKQPALVATSQKTIIPASLLRHFHRVFHFPK